jgi:hypothetical protein
MAKLPKVKIGGHRYRVRYKNGIARHRGALGVSCGSKLSIDLEPDLKRSQINATFWHEVIEQVNDMHELELSHSTITTLGECLYQVLADNPRVVTEFSGR